jgi:hypothetical protein
VNVNPNGNYTCDAGRSHDIQIQAPKLVLLQRKVGQIRLRALRTNRFDVWLRADWSIAGCQLSQLTCNKREHSPRDRRGEWLAPEVIERRCIGPTF